MRELSVSNALLGNHAALDVAWERDGYGFFRSVLDLEAVGRLRRVYVDLLEQLGVVNAGDARVRYNGAGLATFPFRMEPLVMRKACT